jgi:hypothetical protein
MPIQADETSYIPRRTYPKWVIASTDVLDEWDVCIIPAIQFKLNLEGHAIFQLPFSDEG